MAAKVANYSPVSRRLLIKSCVIFTLLTFSSISSVSGRPKAELQPHPDGVNIKAQTGNGSSLFETAQGALQGAATRGADGGMQIVLVPNADGSGSTASFEHIQEVKGRLAENEADGLYSMKYFDHPAYAQEEESYSSNPVVPVIPVLVDGQTFYVPKILVESQLGSTATGGNQGSTGYGYGSAPPPPPPAPTPSPPPAKDKLKDKDQLLLSSLGLAKPTTGFQVLSSTGQVLGSTPELSTRGLLDDKEKDKFASPSPPPPPPPAAPVTQDYSYYQSQAAQAASLAEYGASAYTQPLYSTPAPVYAKAVLPAAPSAPVYVRPVQQAAPAPIYVKVVSASSARPGEVAQGYQSGSSAAYSPVGASTASKNYYGASAPYSPAPPAYSASSGSYNRPSPAYSAGPSEYPGPGAIRYSPSPAAAYSPAPSTYFDSYRPAAAYSAAPSEYYGAATAGSYPSYGSQTSSTYGAYPSSSYAEASSQVQPIYIIEEIIQAPSAVVPAYSGANPGSYYESRSNVGGNSGYGYEAASSAPRPAYYSSYEATSAAPSQAYAYEAPAYYSPSPSYYEVLSSASAGPANAYYASAPTTSPAYSYQQPSAGYPASGYPYEAQSVGFTSAYGYAAAPSSGYAYEAPYFASSASNAAYGYAVAPSSVYAYEAPSFASSASNAAYGYAVAPSSGYAYEAPSLASSASNAAYGYGSSSPAYSTSGYSYKAPSAAPAYAYETPSAAYGASSPAYYGASNPSYSSIGSGYSNYEAPSGASSASNAAYGYASPSPAYSTSGYGYKAPSAAPAYAYETSSPAYYGASAPSYSSSSSGYSNYEAPSVGSNQAYSYVTPTSGYSASSSSGYGYEAPAYYSPSAGNANGVSYSALPAGQQAPIYIIEEVIPGSALAYSGPEAYAYGRNSGSGYGFRLAPAEALGYGYEPQAPAYSAPGLQYAYSAPSSAALEYLAGGNLGSTGYGYGTAPSPPPPPPPAPTPSPPPAKDKLKDKDQLLLSSLGLAKPTTGFQVLSSTGQVLGSTPELSTRGLLDDKDKFADKFASPSPPPPPAPPATQYGATANTQPLYSWPASPNSGSAGYDYGTPPPPPPPAPTPSPPPAKDKLKDKDQLLLSSLGLAKPTSGFQVLSSTGQVLGSTADQSTRGLLDDKDKDKFASPSPPPPPPPAAPVTQDYSYYQSQAAQAASPVEYGANAYAQYSPASAAPVYVKVLPASSVRPVAQGYQSGSSAAYSPLAGNAYGASYSALPIGQQAPIYIIEEVIPSSAIAYSGSNAYGYRSNVGVGSDYGFKLAPSEALGYGYEAPTPVYSAPAPQYAYSAPNPAALEYLAAVAPKAGPSYYQPTSVPAAYPNFAYEAGYPASSAPQAPIYIIEESIPVSAGPKYSAQQAYGSPSTSSRPSYDVRFTSAETSDYSPRAPVSTASGSYGGPRTAAAAPASYKPTPTYRAPAPSAAPSAYYPQASSNVAYGSYSAPAPAVNRGYASATYGTAPVPVSAQPAPIYIIEEVFTAPSYVPGCSKSSGGNCAASSPYGSSSAPSASSSYSYKASPPSASQKY